MDFKIIQEKHNYPEDLVGIYKEIYEALIKYYGEDKEAIIFNSFLSTPIYLVERGSNIYQTLVDNNMLEEDMEDEEIVKTDDLKRASGVHYSSASVEFIDGQYQIQKIKRCIAVSDFRDYNLLQFIATLIHEFGHLVKAHTNECVIKDDKFIERSGLIERTYQLSINENGNVKKSLIEEKGVGLEEGINSYDEENIMRSYFEPDFKMSSYVALAAFARKILENLDIIEDVKQAQFNDDKKALRDKLTPERYDQLEKVMDELYILNLDKFAKMFDSVEMHKTADKMILKVNEELLPIYNEIKSAMGKGI